MGEEKRQSYDHFRLSYFQFAWKCIQMLLIY